MKTLTKNKVIKILEAHGYKFEDLAQDLGDKEVYSIKAVRIWMGY